MTTNKTSDPYVLSLAYLFDFLESANFIRPFTIFNVLKSVKNGRYFSMVAKPFFFKPIFKPILRF